MSGMRIFNPCPGLCTLLLLLLPSLSYFPLHLLSGHRDIPLHLLTSDLSVISRL